MEIQGEIIRIGETEVFGTKGFKKRQIVIKTDSQYPQSVPVDFTQDKCVILDKYKLGQFVKISINIQGSEWQNKFYVNLNGWKIESGEKEKSANSFMPDRNIPMSANDEAQFEADDDLPF